MVIENNLFQIRLHCKQFSLSDSRASGEQEPAEKVLQAHFPLPHAIWIIHVVSRFMANDNPALNSRIPLHNELKSPSYLLQSFKQAWTADLKFLLTYLHWFSYGIFLVWLKYLSVLRRRSATGRSLARFLLERGVRVFPPFMTSFVRW